MRHTTLKRLGCLLAVFIGLTNVSTAAKPEPKVVLSEDGEKLRAKYEGMLNAIQAEIASALPKINEQMDPMVRQASQATAEANAAERALIINGETAKPPVCGPPESKPKLPKANPKAAWVKAQENELTAAKPVVEEFGAFLSSNRLDAKLVEGALLAHATPRGLAEFSQQGPEQAALVEKLLVDVNLMKQMMEAGGAKCGKYGEAMQIYTDIQKASPRAAEGLFQRLALAVSLENALPMAQRNAEEQKDAPTKVDPVKRYLHYEKAYLDGELDPAFKNFSAWEYRMVVCCDAPDDILAWGRQMLRIYLPDNVTNPDYRWRYSATVKSEVAYGMANVKNDLPSLDQYQNIPKDGGVCGRRAFFGRFILRCFGIPTWGMTQHVHAALSHWTPDGWVPNLGAGIDHSWWERVDDIRTGSDFLLETQARENAQEYLKVLRAQWVSRILGEPAYNSRKQIEGGFWSRMAHYQSVVLAAPAVAAHKLAEANQPPVKSEPKQEEVDAEDQQIVVGKDGSITIPSVAHGTATGPIVAMKSFSGGLQTHCGGGFKTQYQFSVARAGKYSLTARVATLQEGQTFLFVVNDAQQPLEVPVPYTVGLWKQTPPAEVSLVAGKNVLHFEVKTGSRAVTIKDFVLTPIM